MCINLYTRLIARPLYSTVSVQGPTAGPCDHCAATESVVWCWHWKDKDRVIRLSCRSYWLKHKVNRPMKREKKCAKCGTTETKGHWHCAYDANGQKTGDDWCSVCAMKNKRDVDKAAKGNDYAICTCSFCGGSNLPAWKAASICLSCWEEKRSDSKWDIRRRGRRGGIPSRFHQQIHPASIYNSLYIVDWGIR